MGVGSYTIFGKDAGTNKTWKKSVPLVPRAMVVAGKTFFVAGRPDPEIMELKQEKDARKRLKIGAALPDEKFAVKGGELWVVSAATGEKGTVIKLESPPVFDGMAAAGGKLYISTLDGTLYCFGD